jgi:metal-responsive CopG/Arc/MetJ family transcriptional regulator
MPRTIKVSGFSDELLALVEKRWARHYGDRSEYIRDLIRKDVLTDARDRRKQAEDPTAGFAVVRESNTTALRLYEQKSISEAALEAMLAKAKAKAKRTPKSRSLPGLG